MRFSYSVHPFRWGIRSSRSLEITAWIQMWNWLWTTVAWRQKHVPAVFLRVCLAFSLFGSFIYIYIDIYIYYIYIYPVRTLVTLKHDIATPSKIEKSYTSNIFTIACWILFADLFEGLPPWSGPWGRFCNCISSRDPRGLARLAYAFAKIGDSPWAAKGGGR